MLKGLRKYLCLVLAVLICSASSHAESHPLYRNAVSLQAGAYQLMSSKSTLSSFGSLNLQYDYHISENWYASAAYQFIIQSTGSSLVSGFDVGGNYCIFSCVSLRSEVGGMVEITEQSKIGLAVGAGFSSRSFQLTTQSVGFSGPYGVLTANYYLASRWKLLSSAQILKLTNGPNALNAQILSLGMGLDF